MKGIITAGVVGLTQMNADVRNALTENLNEME